MASNGEHNEHNLSGQELPLSIMRLYLPRTGRFDSVVAKLKIEIIFFDGVYGELLLRRATWHETLLHPFLYVIDFKRALSFGEAQASLK